MKNVVLYVPDSTAGIYLPLLWASCKSYYELKGQRPNDYHWVHPRLNYEFDTDKLKESLLHIKPDVFGISMYIWNDVQGLEIAKWVKETFPSCLVISGGPQQYFKHQKNWFEQYPFLDASLDGGEYGELTIADILDNLKEDNTVNWNLVNAVVYPSKNKKTILKSKKSTYKRDFAWDYSPYDMQRDVMLGIADEIRSLQYGVYAQYSVNGKLETTRGCPYSCAFCDWGGGIGSKVIVRSVENAKKDIDVLEATGCNYVFLCDANFGILGDRDISIIEYMAERKRKNEDFFHLYFGGFVKSDKHTDVLKKILDLDARHNLTWDLSYKASIQSIHKEVLDNISRTDISFSKHVELAAFLKDNFNFSSYAECISGLPGITPNKWYYEMNVYASHDMDICLYPWSLLPETPSYDQAYRKRLGIETVNKFNNMQGNNSTLRKSEVVVGSYSYTKEDYKEMWIAYTIQRTFWATGFLHKTVANIMKTSNIGYGDFVKLVYYKFFRSYELGHCLKEYINKVDKQFLDYYDENSTVNNTSISFDNGVKSPVSSSLMLTLYYNFDQCRDDIVNWLCSEFNYLDKNTIEKECDLFIHDRNNYSTRRKRFRIINYRHPLLSQFSNEEDNGSISEFMITQMETYTNSKFLTARYLGL